jgi:hypothetical protein
MIKITAKYTLIFLFLVFFTLDSYAAQIAALGYNFITGDDYSTHDPIKIPIQNKGNKSGPDLRGEFEIEAFTVTFSSGQVVHSTSTTFTGVMSITSGTMFQGVTINGNHVVGGGPYDQSSNTITVNNIGFPSTIFSYTWDGTYFVTTITNSSFTETDRWKRTENLSDTIVQPGTVSANLDINIPSLNYTSLLGTQNIWALFEFYGNGLNGELLWKLTNYGEN